MRYFAFDSVEHSPGQSIQCSSHSICTNCMSNTVRMCVYVYFAATVAQKKVTKTNRKNFFSLIKVSSDFPSHALSKLHSVKVLHSLCCFISISFVYHSNRFFLVCCVRHRFCSLSLSLYLPFPSFYLCFSCSFSVSLPYLYVSTNFSNAFCSFPVFSSHMSMSYFKLFILFCRFSLFARHH